MVYIIVIFFVIAFIAWIPFRLAVLHPIATVKYAAVDAYRYILQKGYNNCRTGELVAYVGLFGKGKTLSAVHKVCSMYRRFNDVDVWDRSRQKFVVQKIRVISNVDLTSVPYEKFVSLAQIVAVAENSRLADIDNDTQTITLVLGDEFSVQLNSRSFKTNINPLFLNTLLTSRHHHISIFYTAQRFSHVDALLRQVTSYVVNCEKLWRFQIHRKYDAWEMENATNPALIKPLAVGGFFVFNRDYAAYDTLACVGNLKKSCDAGDMLSEPEILALQCNTGANMEAVSAPSKKFVRNQKKMHK